MDDRKTYLANFLEPFLKINLSIEMLFIISMIAPFVWQSLGISIWDKSILWVSYFIFLDILLLFFYPLFYKEKSFTDFLFDKDKIASDIKNLQSIKKIYLGLILLILLLGALLIISYLYFWFILTPQYILFNLNYLLMKFNELPFVYLVVLLTTGFFINLTNESIYYKYKMQVLVLKQEKYRDIRRELYESENPNLENLMSEFKLNAPW